MKSEYDIRAVLGSDTYTILLQDGREIKGSNLLPSAFMNIVYSDDVYSIYGGGYGHGIGMSQNGANEMAKTGLGYEEILKFFYTGSEILVL